MWLFPGQPPQQHGMEAAMVASLVSRTSGIIAAERGSFAALACGAGAPAMVPEEWECHRSWVRAWPEGGERRTVNGSGHEHRPTGRRKLRKSVVQKAVLRRGRYARHCVLKAIAAITALSASLLYSSTQRVVRNCSWPTGRLITGTASQRPHREDRGDVRSPILYSTPRSPTVRSALSYSAGGADLKNQAPAQAGA